MLTIDGVIQYGEDCDVKIRDDFDPPEDDDPTDFLTDPNAYEHL